MPVTDVRQLREDFERRREALGFADSNAWIGPPLEPVFGSRESVDELAGLLRRSGVREALVTHTACLKYDWAEGSRLTLEAVAGRDDLHAAIALVPPNAGEIASVGDHLDEAIARKARAVRLFPKSHSFSLAEWCAGSILSEMQARRMPLILWHSETTWDHTHSLCLAYPELPVIVEGAGRKILYDNRMFYQLLADCPNFCLELHNLTNCFGIEDIVARFGAERLVFGSFAPYREPAAAIMAVTHARISDEHKRLIAGGNLRALIEAVRTGGRDA
jgi:predicted TIM-barrel fold metal-dependent hydrolase